MYHVFRHQFWFPCTSLHVIHPYDKLHHAFPCVIYCKQKTLHTAVRHIQKATIWPDTVTLSTQHMPAEQVRLADRLQCTSKQKEGFQLEIRLSIQVGNTGSSFTYAGANWWATESTPMHVIISACSPWSCSHLPLTQRGAGCSGSLSLALDLQLRCTPRHTDAMLMEYHTCMYI